MNIRVFIVWLAVAWLPVQHAHGGESPQELVIDTTRRVLTTLNENHEALQKDPARLYALVNEIILPAIDFDAFAKLSLGRYWRTATKAQRERFVREFRGMLMRTYTHYLLDYSGTRVELSRRQPKGDGKRQVVNTLVILPGEAPLQVNYYFWKRDGKWKAYNVSFGGLSLVQLFREDLARDIQERGIDAMIDRLAETNVRTGVVSPPPKD